MRPLVLSAMALCLVLGLAAPASADDWHHDHWNRGWHDHWGHDWHHGGWWGRRGWDHRWHGWDHGRFHHGFHNGFHHGHFGHGGHRH